MSLEPDVQAATAALQDAIVAAWGPAASWLADRRPVRHVVFESPVVPSHGRNKPNNKRQSKDTVPIYSVNGNPSITTLVNVCQAVDPLRRHMLRAEELLAANGTVSRPEGGVSVRSCPIHATPSP